ncbi:MAG TPA: cytochrome C oxidase subunit IV family protein [Phycisphaerales bacterium]|nr:cytochrome C oxidase subunit IV family protein [Phycisphaerales bacterium]
MAHTPAADSHGFNELDPHGFEGHGQHASHVIVGPFTLRTVLAFLLLFTALTVATAQLETAIMGWFDITLPWWVNVAVAMSIATVKAIMVMAYFMQLKYDNPINTVLMLFTFGALAIFLFFTGLDLFSRGAVDPIKQNQVVAGGTGSGITSKPNQAVALGAKERFLDYLAVLQYAKAKSTELTATDANTARALTDAAATLQRQGRGGDARQRFVSLLAERIGEGTPAFEQVKQQVTGTMPEPILAAAQAEFERIHLDVAGHGATAHHEEAPLPGPNRTMPRTGTTGALSEAAPHAPHGDHNGHDHDTHPAGDHSH